MLHNPLCVGLDRCSRRLLRQNAGLSWERVIAPDDHSDGPQDCLQVIAAPKLVLNLPSNSAMVLMPAHLSGFQVGQAEIHFAGWNSRTSPALGFPRNKLRSFVAVRTSFMDSTSH